MSPLRRSAEFIRLLRDNGEIALALFEGYVELKEGSPDARGNFCLGGSLAKGVEHREEIVPGRAGHKFYYKVCKTPFGRE